MSEEQPFNYKRFMCLLSCPCTICCGICYMHKHLKNPSDAEKLSEHEAKEYLDQLHGNKKNYISQVLTKIETATQSICVLDSCFQM